MSGGAEASRPIRKRDRVASVLQRDPDMVEAFVEVSPAFERLRDSGMRKVMARLATVEKAARVAGVDTDRLVAHLNARAGTKHKGENMSPDRNHETPAPEEGGVPVKRQEMPEALAAIPDDRVVEADVREDLRSGREPFSRIMDARSQVPEAGALVVRAIFEPAPLYDVMARYGFTHWTEQLAADDWRVWFYPAAEPPTAPQPHKDPGAGDDEGHPDAAIVLDVRGLEPPEPMMRTLAALEELPPGGHLVQINARVPRFLFPRLEERGFAWTVDEEAPDGVRVTIWDPSDEGNEGAGDEPPPAV